MNSLFLKYPAAVMAVALMAGVGLSAVLPIPALFWGALLALTGVCFLGSLFLRPRRPLFGWVMLFFFTTFLGGYRYQAVSQLPKGIGRFSPGPVVFRGIVEDDPDSVSWGSRFTLKPQEDPEVGVRVGLRKCPVAVSYGDMVEVKGELGVPPGQRNPGGFDYRAYLRQNGVYFLLDAKGDSVVTVLARGQGNPVIRNFVLPLRREVFQVFGATLNGEPEALLKGLILGERSDLPHETIDAFADTGTVHILAVSGLNVSLVILVFFLLFRALGFSPTLANLLLIPLLVLYAGLTDFTPSVVRATIMALVFIIGFLLEREPLSLNSLGAAALLILILWPQALYGTSFQLSFAATFGIAFLAPRLNNLLSEDFRKTLVAKWVVLPVIVSLSATMFSTPLILRTFYRLSLISPLSNLVILPMVTLSTALGFAQVLAGFMSISLSRIFAAANWPVLKAILVSTKFFAHLPYSAQRFGLPGLSLISIYGLLLSTPWVRRQWVARVAFAASAVLFIAPLTGRVLETHSKIMTVTFIDVGEGDAALLEFPNGRALLLDGGNAYEGWNAGEQDVAPFLWEHGRTCLDAVVASHLHQDHVGGLPFILEHCRVSRLIESEASCSTSAGAALHRAVRKCKIPHYQIEAGDTLFIDSEVDIRALSPTPEVMAEVQTDPEPDPNLTSVVLKVTYRGVSFLFPGDLPSEADAALFSQGYDISSTVLKVPHHGSLRGSSPDFVQAVHPRLAVVSLSENNSHSFPNPSVVELYHQAGTRILRTDQEGAISVKTDGQRLWYRTQTEPQWIELPKP